MAEQIAKFRFKGYKIVESYIATNPEEETSQNLNVEFLLQGSLQYKIQLFYIP